MVRSETVNVNPAAPPLIYNGNSDSSNSDSSESSDSTESDAESPAKSNVTDSDSEPVEKPLEFDNPDDYITYNPQNGEIILPPELEALANESMFVGDSVCRGFMAYGYVNAKQSFADGSIGARNLLESTVYYGGKDREFVSVLKEVNPRRLFLSMGMNDVNMTTAEEYYENLRNIVETSLKNCSADVYLCAITPIRADFTEEGRIDAFNAQIRKLTDDYSKLKENRVHFIDYTAPLMDENGKLLEKYDGGDGIHLTREVYFIALHEIYNRIHK